MIVEDETGAGTALDQGVPIDRRGIVHVDPKSAMQTLDGANSAGVAQPRQQGVRQGAGLGRHGLA